MSKIKILSPFGPKITKIKISPTLIKKINVETDRILFSKKSIKKNDYSKHLVGQVRQELQLSKKFILNNLEKFIIKKILSYIYKVENKKPKKIKIINFWVVRQFKNDYNPVHYHDGDISGVGYLKIPRNLNYGEKKIKTNGTIDFVNGTRAYLSRSIYNHLPKVGDLIVFPNYLMHVAYPFKVEGERRSFSFNVKIN